MAYKKKQGMVPKRRRGNRRQKQYVPGWGGMIGRGLGLAQKTFTSRGSIAHKALRLARKVADAVNIEYKHSDYGTTLSVDNAGTGSLISFPLLIAQGITDNERIGDSLKMQKLTMRYLIFNNAANFADVNYVRCIIFVDPQNQITTPGNLLQVVGTGAAPISPKNYDNRFRSRILYDKTHRLDVAHPAEPMADFVLDINEHTQFQAGTTTINTGDLKVLFISSIAAGGTLPLALFYSRLTYTDD